MVESPLEKIEGIEQLRAIENHKKLKVVEVSADTISVDTPQDLENILENYKSEFI